MAKFHKNLKYHEDTTPRHKMTDEEREFLKELQTELNTQDHVSQADPRFWVIKGREKMYHVEADEADGYELYNENTAETVAETIQECKDFIEENILDEVNDIDGLQRTISIEKDAYCCCQDNYIIVIEWEDDGEKEREELRDAEDVADWLSENGFDEYCVIPYKWVDKIYENTMFLTEKDAAKHLKANDYHYDETAHTYAMTAWRSTVMEKLIKILQEVEF